MYVVHIMNFLLKHKQRLISYKNSEMKAKLGIAKKRRLERTKTYVLT